ncbi:MAG: patatin-like phospholipase family protein [Deltaproteobacteria bacterium]|jgi:NTE family protein|nr:patatin-like phospholipase family protein [Deltaproteobacteria bacterium]
MRSQTSEDLQIGLALSGGGIRAMAFHSGVLRWLAEAGPLSHVTHISSVSGGSLLMGLILRLSDWSWPSAEQYKTVILPQTRKILTTQDLAIQAILRLIHPMNWKYLLSRANILARTIKTTWGINAHLSDLPEVPVWSINGTTAETGRRFRFKRTAVGDYELGYADAANFKVADTMAISAAFPGLIGPFAIRTDDYAWYKRESWNAKIETAEKKQPPFEHLHLYDGGVYDNLGIEPLFDSGKQEPKDGVNFILVSDAGTALPRTKPRSPLNPFRLKRVVDIISDQTRALRVRSFVAFLQTNPEKGAYFQIGADARKKIETYKQQNPSTADTLLKETWLNAQDAVRAASYATTLRRMREDDFDLLERHGYETAKWNLKLFSKSI